MTHDTREVEEFEKSLTETLKMWTDDAQAETTANWYTEKFHHQLQKAREEERKQVLWNIGAMIEKAEFDAKVAERTGDATSTWEVQSVIKQIQTIIDRYQAELNQDVSK